MTNSNRKIHHKTNTQSYGLIRHRRDQATVLDFSPEMGRRSGSDERGDVVKPANDRSADQRDPARTAALADSILPDGHTTALRLTDVGSFALTCRPRRPANNKFAQLTHSQHAVSVRLYSQQRISSIRTADD